MEDRDLRLTIIGKLEELKNRIDKNVPFPTGEQDRIFLRTLDNHINEVFEAWEE